MNILSRTITKRPKRVLFSFGLLFILAVLLTGTLRFEQDIFKILPQHNRTFKVLMHALRSSTDQDSLYLLIRGPGDRRKLIEAGQALCNELKGIRVNGTAAFSKASSLKSEAIGTKGFQDLLIRYLSRPETFLTEKDLPRLESLLTGEDDMERELKRSLALLATPGASGLSNMVAMDPLNFRRFLLEKLQTLHQGLAFAPGRHLVSPDGHALLIVATPAEAARNRSAVQPLLKKIRALGRSHGELKIGVTGGYVVAAQEEALVRGDILSCLIGSALGIAALFFLVYRNIIALTFVLLPLGVGLQLALGVMALLFDRVHLLALAFSAVVLGLGIDFAIHIYDRYAMERQAGKSIDQAIEGSLFRTGPAVLAGGLTTLAAFLVLTVTDSPLLYQIGWVVPLGLLFCLMTILWALPACLVWLEGYPWPWTKGSMKLLGMDRIGAWINRRPGLALLVSALILGLILPGISRIQFDDDPLALKPEGLEALEVQQDLVRAFGSGREYVIMAWPSKDVETLFRKGRGIDKALAEAKQAGTITSWTSMSRLSSHRPHYVKGVDRAGIDDLFRKYGLRLADFTYTARFLNAIAEGSNKAKTPFGQHIRSCEELDAWPGLFRRFFMCGQDHIEGIAWARASDERSALALKRQLTRSFPHLVVVNPRLAVKELLGEAGGGLWTTLGLSALLVLTILTIFFRRPSFVMLALLPMAMGLLTTAGVMGWAGIPINLFN
ncbi:MAG: MMPL family transporter, partial [Deltaproteobacteria bacterium]|nr:MMPL family transporter [Deltaproteobacteria bacterium]